jgi:hypothetical protein
LVAGEQQGWRYQPQQFDAETALSRHRKNEQQWDQGESEVLGQRRGRNQEPRGKQVSRTRIVEPASPAHHGPDIERQHHRVGHERGARNQHGGRCQGHEGSHQCRRLELTCQGVGAQQQCDREWQEGEMQCHLAPAEQSPCGSQVVGDQRRVLVDQVHELHLAVPVGGEAEEIEWRLQDMARHPDVDRIVDVHCLVSEGSQAGECEQRDQGRLCESGQQVSLDDRELR